MRGVRGTSEPHNRRCRCTFGGHYNRGLVVCNDRSQNGGSIRSFACHASMSRIGKIPRDTQTAACGGKGGIKRKGIMSLPPFYCLVPSLLRDKRKIKLGLRQSKL